MSTSLCVAYNCNKRGGFRFPKDNKLKKQWVKAIKRKNFTPSKYSVLCGDHFKNEEKITFNEYGLKLLRARLKPNAVPSIFKVKYC